MAETNVTERMLAPRSTLLNGTAEEPSKSGGYVVTFPPPNSCVELHVQARSRGEALYRGVSRGGFSLQAGDGGLTVWTDEEWAEASAQFKKATSAFPLSPAQILALDTTPVELTPEDRRALGFMP